jgi:hypothetical protein
MTINGLPVMNNFSRVFTNKVRLNLPDGCSDGSGPTFQERFSQSDDSGVSVNLQKDPARFDQKRFQLRDPDLLLLPDRGALEVSRGRERVNSQQSTR